MNCAPDLDPRITWIILIISGTLFFGALLRMGCELWRESRRFDREVKKVINDFMAADYTPASSAVFRQRMIALIRGSNE